MFQKHICPPWCKIQVYLLWRSKTCPKQVSKGLKYIKWTTHWAQKSCLTLAFEHVTLKSIGIIYLLMATPAASLVLIKWRGQKIWADNTVGWEEKFDLDIWTCDLKIIGIIYLFGATLHQVCYWSSEGFKRYAADNTVGWEEWFDFDLWTCYLKINKDHLLIESTLRQVWYRVKGSKDIERTTLGLQTDRPTVAKQNAPLFKGGINILRI